MNWKQILGQKEYSRIKNHKTAHMRKDFGYNAFSFLILAFFIAGASITQFFLGNGVDPLVIVQFGGSLLGCGVLLALFSWWQTVIILQIGFFLSSFYRYGSDYLIFVIIASLGIMVSAGLQLVYQWDKVVVLRMGKFRKVYGPGIFFLLPFIDRVASFVDTRIRVTDFSAEKTLTIDTVPVHVDALAFWMIWDARRAVLEVEDYLEAVSLSAQTALRDSIGRHDLSSLLSGREELGHEIQQSLDKKTNPWGITILSIEFTDIIIPRELEDAMSKKAQAERERQSRVILGSAEVEISEKFAEAAKQYENNPTALQLRAMNMVYEGIRQNKGTLMMMPSSALDQMNVGGTLGATALGKNIMDKKEDFNEDPESGKEE